MVRIHSHNRYCNQDLLGLNAADLEESLCCGDIIVNGEKVQKRLTRDEAEGYY